MGARLDRARITVVSFDLMHLAATQALVRTILEHPEDLAWRMQDIGLLGLRLDDRRQHRLHVWDSSDVTGAPLVHDHPYDFVSTVVVGEMTNTRYLEDADGTEHWRVRYSTADEAARRTDSVRLHGTPTTFGAGDEYAQQAHDLHASAQVPGTVTLIRMDFRPVTELTVCSAGDAPWDSSAARAATIAEIRHITALALAQFP